MKMKRIVLAAALAFGLAFAAAAQTQPPIMTAQVWLPQSRLAAPVTVNSVSSVAALPSPGFIAFICNLGSQDAYLAFGTSGSLTVSTTTGSWLKAQGCGSYSLVPNPGNISPVNSFIAAITVSGSTTLYIEAGQGTPPDAANGGSIAVTQGTSPWVVSTVPYAYTPLSPMQAGVGVATSTALTIPATATYAVVCVSGAAVNYTTDGTTTPTNSVGMPLAATQCVSLVGPAVLAAFRAIQQAPTATLNVSYFK